MKESRETSCTTAELSLLRRHADQGFFQQSSRPEASGDASAAVAAGLHAKGMVDAGGVYTTLAWSSLAGDGGRR